MTSLKGPLLLSLILWRPLSFQSWWSPVPSSYQVTSRTFCHTHLSRGSFTTIEQSTHDEGTKGPVVGAAHFPDPTSTQSIEYRTTGMWLLF